MKKKLYFVKSEVLAHGIKEAITARGTIYEIVMAQDQPVENKKIGFKKK